MILDYFYSIHFYIVYFFIVQIKSNVEIVLIMRVFYFIIQTAFFLPKQVSSRPQTSTFSAHNTMPLFNRFLHRGSPIFTIWPWIPKATLSFLICPRTPYVTVTPFT